MSGRTSSASSSTTSRPSRRTTITQATIRTTTRTMRRTGRKKGSEQVPDRADVRASLSQGSGASGQFCVVAPDVVLGRDVSIYNFVNLYGCEIGDNSRIGSFVEIQKGARVGRN